MQNIIYTWPNKNFFPVTFSYVQNGSVAGYLNIQVLYDEVEIHFIEVQVQFRRQGIAQQLLQTCEQACRESTVPIKRILLEVNENNQSAINLYKKLGYGQISSRKSYYNGVDTALIMEKIL